MSKPIKITWNKFNKIIKNLQIKYRFEKLVFGKLTHDNGYGTYVCVTNHEDDYHEPALNKSFGTVINGDEKYEVEQLIMYRLDETYTKEKLYEFLTELVDTMSKQSKTKYILNLPSDPDSFPTITWPGAHEGVKTHNEPQREKVVVLKSKTTKKYNS